MTAVADLKKKKKLLPSCPDQNIFILLRQEVFFPENDDCFHDRLHGFSYIDSIRWWSVSNV